MAVTDTNNIMTPVCLPKANLSPAIRDEPEAMTKKEWPNGPALSGWPMGATHLRRDTCLFVCHPAPKHALTRTKVRVCFGAGQDRPELAKNLFRRIETSQ